MCVQGKQEEHILGGRTWQNNSNFSASSAHLIDLKAPAFVCCTGGVFTHISALSTLGSPEWRSDTDSSRDNTTAWDFNLSSSPGRSSTQSPPLETPKRVVRSTVDLTPRSLNLRAPHTETRETRRLRTAHPACLLAQTSALSHRVTICPNSP